MIGNTLFHSLSFSLLLTTSNNKKNEYPSDLLPTHGSNFLHENIIKHENLACDIV